MKEPEQQEAKSIDDIHNAAYYGGSPKGAAWSYARCLDIYRTLMAFRSDGGTIEEYHASREEAERVVQAAFEDVFGRKIK